MRELHSEMENDARKAEPERKKRLFLRLRTAQGHLLNWKSALEHYSMLDCCGAAVVFTVNMKDSRYLLKFKLTMLRKHSQNC